MHDYNWKRGVRSHFATASPDCGERINSGKTIFGRRSGSRQKGVLYTHPTACHRLGWSVRYYVGSRQARALIVPSETPCGFLSLQRRDHPHDSLRPERCATASCIITFSFLLGSLSTFFPRSSAIHSFRSTDCRFRPAVVSSQRLSHPTPHPTLFDSAVRVDSWCLMHDGAESQRYFG